MNTKTTKLQRKSRAAFLLYLVVLTYFTIFAESMGRGAGGEGELRYNLVLFAEIRRFWIYRRQLGLQIFLLNVVGNVLAFMPCGLLIPAASRRSPGLLRTVSCGFLISLLIECTQLIFRVGSFDVDDLMLNTTGVFLGFLLNRRIRKYRENKASA